MISEGYSSYVYGSQHDHQFKVANEDHYESYRRDVENKMLDLNFYS